MPQVHAFVKQRKHKSMRGETLGGPCQIVIAPTGHIMISMRKNGLWLVASYA